MIDGLTAIQLAVTSQQKKIKPQNEIIEVISRGKYNTTQHAMHDVRCMMCGACCAVHAVLKYTRSSKNTVHICTLILSMPLTVGW